MLQGQGVTPVTDICGIYFDPDGWRAYLNLFAERAPGYLKNFAPVLAERAGVDAQTLATVVDSDLRHGIDLIASGLPLQPPLDAYVANLRRAGVVRQVLHGNPGRLEGGGTVNDRLVQLASPYADVLEVWPGLDVGDPDAALAELDRCTRDLGTRGASIVHWWGGRDPLAPECERLYARAEELGVPLWLHTGMSFASNHAFDFCSWSDIDHIASRHPELVVIAGHGGWPWILEGVAVLQRHANVYLDISAHRPRHMHKRGSGWEPLLHYGRHVVREKVLFGSVTWIHTASIQELIAEVWELELGGSATRAWLHGNAARILSSSLVPASTTSSR